MSYITPSSYIYVLEGVPFDETYQHSIYFANTTAQYNYFSSKIKYRFNAQSYQRVKRGYCRVQQKADAMYGCNYMMFQNTNYGTKWFYAFILDVEYINDNVSEIHYEIDVLQSWIFSPASGSTEYDPEFHFNKCFVEREHTVTDNLWQHTVPEGLEIGDYVLEELIDEDDVFRNGEDVGANEVTIMTASGSTNIYDQTQPIEKLPGRWVNGVYSGAAVQQLGDYTDSGAEANGYINRITEAGQSDSIVAIFMCPDAFFNVANDKVPYTEEHTVTKPTQYVGTYEVRNKKLLNSPYQHILVDIGTDAGVYCWEYFSTSFNTATLVIKGTVLENAKYMVYPRLYKRVYDNYNEAIVGTAGAQCGYAIDSYKAWYASNQYVLSAQEKVMTRNLVNQSVQAIVNGTQQALTGAQYTPETSGRSIPVSYEGAISGPSSIAMPGSASSFAVNPVNVANGVINAGQDIANAGVQYANAREMLNATKSAAVVKPNCPRGSSVNSLYMSVGINKPRFYNQHIRAEYAEIIDGYFDRYGYAVHTFKIPTLNNRPNWTYVKTVDCTIRGNIPNDDSTKICKIMNTGITFWMNGNNVGNYTLNNRPT